MAFEPSDFEDLIRYLDEHPDVRDQLRRRILSDDFLRLPVVVHELGEAFVRIEGTLDRIGASLERTNESLQSLSAAQERTDRSVARLAAALERTEQSLSELTESQKRTDATVQVTSTRLDKHAGLLMEDRYRERAPSYFGHLLRRPRVIEVDDLELIDTAIKRGDLNEDDFDQLLVARHHRPWT